jgi:hypothetical protein
MLGSKSLFAATVVLPTFSYIFDSIETVGVIPRMSESDASADQRPAEVSESDASAEQPPEEITESIHAVKLGPLTVEAPWQAWTAFAVGLFIGFIPTALVVYDVVWGGGKLGLRRP